jgi:O-antigen/teichoic acid export membrane protein
MASALVVTAIILPLVLLAGAVISWYAPYVANADPAYYSLIRITCSLLILSLAIARVFDLFEAVLRGMNLGYKRMGFRAGIVMCGGALKVFVITSGYGIIGLSAVQILITIITGLTFYFIVKKHVGWFGFGKTNFKNVVSFGKLSGWNMANTTTDTLLSNTDKVLLGFVAGPVMVSTYALTIFLPLAIQGMITRVIIGVMPGMGKLIGLQEYEKINRVRGNINDFIFLLTTASGVTIILFNHSFLNIWVGEGHYAGNLVNALVMLMLIQDTFIKHDGYLITATLNLKKKVYLTCISALVFLVSGYILINQLGMIGLCISLTGGKFLLFVGQRKFLKTTIQQRMVPFFKGMRPIVVSFSMLVIAYILSTFITPVSFVKLLEFAPLTFVGSFLLFYVTGLKKESRAAMVKIASSVKYFKSN